MSTVLILGSTGYIGSQFLAEVKRRGWSHHAPSRHEADYTRYGVLVRLLRDLRPAFLINAAGYTGKPNVDACESHRSETLQGNALFPLTVAQACESAGVAWGHVSSGCIYAGAKVADGGTVRIEKDLTLPALRSRVESNRASILGFSEEDAPNFSFRSPPCSFYSGSKALGEEALSGSPSTYVWRLRIPFDEVDGARNYLSKVQRYAKVYDNVNSISHRADFARAALDLWERRAPFGVYNITNPGFVTTREVIQAIERRLKPSRRFEFWASDEEFYRVAAQTPRSNCVLDVSKLLATGISLRPVHEALEDALSRWVPETLAG